MIPTVEPAPTYKVPVVVIPVTDNPAPTVRLFSMVTFVVRPIVTVLPEPTVSISFAVPRSDNTSVSRSIDNGPPMSA